jgi:hypothetical protein
MRYVCLVHFEWPAVFELPPSDAEKLIRDSEAYNEELRASGHLVVAHALQKPEAATIVRVRDDRMSATDGPFAETREVLGGFMLIEARDLNEAIRVASGIPLAKLGSIEVRPVLGR